MDLLSEVLFDGVVGRIFIFAGSYLKFGLEDVEKQKCHMNHRGGCKLALCYFHPFTVKSSPTIWKSLIGRH